MATATPPTGSPTRWQAGPTPLSTSLPRAAPWRSCDLSTLCFLQSRPGVGPPPSSARSVPAARNENRVVAGTLVADLSRQKLFPSLLLAHRRQREADPPPGLAAWQKPHCEPRPGGVPRWDPRNRVD